MIRCVIARRRNSAEIKTLQADVNVRAVQTPVADVLRTFTTRIAPVTGVQNVRITSLALLNFLQCHN